MSAPILTPMASVVHIKNYFGCDGRPVSAAEMQAFWKPLSEEEKDFYKRGIAQILGL